MKLMFFISLFLLSCGAMPKGVKQDDQMSAVMAGDYTGLIYGCMGNQPIPGFLYCREIEGSATTRTITFISPDPNCGGDRCVEIKVYNQQASLVWGYAFQKGERSKTIQWNVLTRKDTFDQGDRGFWAYVYLVTYIADDGKEYDTITQGEIRMRVVKAEYQNLDNVKFDHNFVWKFVYEGTPIKMTTGGRTWIGLPGEDMGEDVDPGQNQHQVAR